MAGFQLWISAQWSWMIPFLHLVVLLMALIQSWKKWLTQHLATHSFDDFMILHSYILILPPSPPTKGLISRIKAFGTTALNNKHNHVVVTCCYHVPNGPFQQTELQPFLRFQRGGLGDEMKSDAAPSLCSWSCGSRHGVNHRNWDSFSINAYPWWWPFWEDWWSVQRCLGCIISKTF